MAEPQPEVWDSPEVLEQETYRLLRSLRDEGPMADDHVDRFCLRVSELASMLRDQDRTALSMNTAEALSQFLADEGASKPLADSIKDWRKQTSITRWSFKWGGLPPSLHSLAMRRRAVLLQHTQQLGWIQRAAPEQPWHVTPAGLAAVNEVDGQ
ncbi:MAG: hypothetical protein IT442_12235 [Phycisphaeraceae bacterium]|nr:hypothetical protein [Phycisphaeraceae bacterium]